MKIEKIRLRSFYIEKRPANVFARFKNSHYVLPFHQCGLEYADCIPCRRVNPHQKEESFV